jgi:RNA polymerase sigma-70 factor (ECF subfamily)
MAFDANAEKSALIACQAGDLIRFGEIYDAYIRRIFAFIYLKTHHREIAEDLTSQTFIKALEAIGSFNRDKGAFSTWIYRIARNTVIDHYRASRPTTDIEDAWDLAAPDAELPRTTDIAMAVDRIRPHLADLSPIQRDIVTMRLWQDLPYSDIAEALGMSEAACKMSFSRSMRSLRDKIGLLGVLLLLLAAGPRL